MQALSVHQKKKLPYLHGQKHRTLKKEHRGSTLKIVDVRKLYEVNHSYLRDMALLEWYLLLDKKPVSLKERSEIHKYMTSLWKVKEIQSFSKSYCGFKIYSI